MKTKHTPGPWFAKKNIDVIGSDHDAAGWIVSTYPKTEGDYVPVGGVICEITDCEEDNIAANARLIAAAPEILHGLKIALAALETPRSPATIHDSIAVIKRAIRKAEGKE